MTWCGNLSPTWTVLKNINCSHGLTLIVFRLRVERKVVPTDFQVGLKESVDEAGRHAIVKDTG